VCRSEDARRKQHRLRESHRIHAKVTTSTLSATVKCFESDILLLV